MITPCRALLVGFVTSPATIRFITAVFALAMAIAQPDAPIIGGGGA